jgi:hypothetical protein
MDPKEGDYVRFKHKRVETTGTVIKRSGTHVRVQPEDGGATLWKELPCYHVTFRLREPISRHGPFAP